MVREDVEEKFVPTDVRFSLDTKVRSLVLFINSSGCIVTNVRRKYVREGRDYLASLIFDLDIGEGVYEMEGDIALEGYRPS